MLKGYFLIATILLFPSLSWAEDADCLASTNTPQIAHGYPNVVKQILDEKEGIYLASLSSGDQVLVKYSPCELALRAHYLFYKDENIDQIRETIKTFLAGVVPSKVDIETVDRQLDQLHKLNLGESILIQGKAGQHKLIFIKSKSPIFVLEVHYEWLPPSY